MRRSTAAVLAILLCCLTFGTAQDKPTTADKTAAQAMAKKAAEILKHDLGTWDCEWTYLDKDGEPAQRVKGTETMRFAMGNKIVEMTTSVPADKVVSKSLRFYNSVTQKLTVLSVGADGNHWEMNQDVDSDVMISTAHAKPDGSKEFIRFTTLEKSDDAMKVVMEISNDGQTWRKVFYQAMNRRKN